MKSKNLLTKAKDKLKIATEERVVEMLKKNLKDIADCKKTLKRLEEKHKTMCETDVEQLETDGFEY